MPQPHNPSDEMFHLDVREIYNDFDETELFKFLPKPRVKLD